MVPMLKRRKLKNHEEFSSSVINVLFEIKYFFHSNRIGKLILKEINTASSTVEKF